MTFFGIVYHDHLQTVTAMGKALGINQEVASKAKKKGREIVEKRGILDKLV